MHAHRVRVVINIRFQRKKLLYYVPTKRSTWKFLNVGTYIKNSDINNFLLMFRLKYLSTWRTFQMKAKLLFMQAVTNVSLKLGPVRKFWNQTIFVLEDNQQSLRDDLYFRSASRTANFTPPNGRTSEISNPHLFVLQTIPNDRQNLLCSRRKCWAV